MRTIRVTGKGRVKCAPDLTRLSFTVQGTEPDYADALARSSRDSAALRAVLAELGFAGDDLKTLSFDVDTRYEGYQDEKGEWRQRFVGYAFTHLMKLEFPSDNALLGRLLYALAHAPVETEFRLSYTVRDPEAAKTALLAAAVQDATAKARALADAAGVKLGALQNIDYSRNEIDFEVRPVNRMLTSDAAPMAKGSYDMDLTPEDIETADTVTLVWEIA